MPLFWLCKSEQVHKSVCQIKYFLITLSLFGEAEGPLCDLKECEDVILKPTENECAFLPLNQMVYI